MKKIALMVVVTAVLLFMSLSLIIANAINKDWLKLSKN